MATKRGDLGYNTTRSSEAEVSWSRPLLPAIPERIVPEPLTPEWVRDAIFYQIFPDRFARSESVAKPTHIDAWGEKPTHHGYQGGDLVGVVEHLDYLVDLGVNAIYFTPIFQSASNHRYHTHDYYRVDPMLGGNDALRLLLDEAHKRGIKVVLDGVFNHASRGFFQFHDILENGKNSAYLDWFTVHEWPINAYDHSKPPGYGAWWNLHALPKFNVKTPAARKFLLDVARYWIDFGIDGWRLDVAAEIEDDDFWREFRATVREGNPEAYIVGEVWHDSAHWLKGDMWDAVMNYLFTRSCIAFFCGENTNLPELATTSFRTPDPAGAPAFRAAIEKLLGLYPPNINAVLLNLLSSHDMPRFLTLANDDLSSLRLAMLFQMTYPGAPSVYYGDEIGVNGGHDPANRKAFPWHHRSLWNQEFFQDVRRLIALRKQHAALRRGSFAFLLAQDDVIAYQRVDSDSTFVICINASQTPQRINVPVQLAEGTRLGEAWTDATVVVQNGRLNNILLPPRAGRVFATSLDS